MSLSNLIRLLLIVSFMLAIDSSVDAYDDQETHPKLSNRAVFFSNLDDYLIQSFGSQFPQGFDSLIKGGKIIDRIAEGSKLEDRPLPRASTHFHNPLKSWGTAGASEVIQTIFFTYNSPNPGTQYSALVWATGRQSYDGTVVNPNNQTMWNIGDVDT